MLSSIDRTESKRERSVFRTLLPIVGIAFALRMAVVFFTYRDLPDADKFYEAFGWEMGWVARALASGHGFSSPYWPWSGPTAMQPPLYPFLVSLVFRVFGIYTLTAAFVVLSINSLLSSCISIPLYFSAKFSLGARPARIAAWVWAFYPFAIYFSAGRVWEYSLTGLLFTTSFCIAQRIHGNSRLLAWMGWGALAGLTALSNPSTLSTLPFLALVAAWRLFRSGSPLRPALTRYLLVGVAAAAVLTPWTIRNYQKLGILCPVRDNFWLEFYDDNGGDTSLDPSFAHPSSNPDEMKKWLAMGEPAFLAEKHDLAIQYFRQHPDFFFRKTPRRILYYWTGFWSLSAQELREQPYEPLNIGMVCAITFFMLRGIRRLWRMRRAVLAPYLVLLLLFPCTYYITHALMDYRQPIEPAIVVLAVAGAIPRRLLNDNSEEAMDQEELLEYAHA